MIKIKILKNDNIIVGLECSGHSGYADFGSDIVCSAVSTATQMCVLGLQQVAKIPMEYCQDDQRGYLFFKIHEGISEKQSEQAELLLHTTVTTLKDLQINYSKFIVIQEK